MRQLGERMKRLDCADITTIKTVAIQKSGDTKGFPDILIVLLLCIIGTPIYVTFLLSFGRGGIVLQEGHYEKMCSPHYQLAAYLYQHYDHGSILIDVTTLDLEAGAAHIDFKNVIYQGSQHYWTDALAHPERSVTWVILNPHNPFDHVAQHISYTSQTFDAYFELVAMQSDGAMLFHRRGFPPLPNRAPLPQYSYPHYPCQQ